MKRLDITTCTECPHCVLGFRRKNCDHPAFGNEALWRPIKGIEIPSWCPLPDSESKEPEFCADRPLG